MKRNALSNLVELFTHNLSFKLVSLVIAVILWVAVLGRRDFIVTKSLEIDVILSPNVQIVTQSTDRIKVKVLGPRAAVRKFIEGGYSQFVTLDLSKKELGKYKVNLESERFDIPFGAKILNIQPRELDIELGASK